MTTEQLPHLLQNLAKMNLGRVAFDERLSPYNSWKLGGTADLFIEPENSSQVAEVCRYVVAHEIPLVVIGQGTNLLFDDAGVRGVVLRIGEKMADITISGNTIIAAGGAWVPSLSRQSMRAGLSGLEHCIGIPGTVGGLVMMNGGSQHHGIGENVVNVTVVDQRGSIRQLTQSECQFSYRYSALQGTGCVVTSVELSCPRGDKREIRLQMLADLKNRRHKFPRKQPNCGSVFLSNAEMHATVGPPGKIIESAGLKGLRIGQAEISRQHANFIVNLGGAKSSDVLALIASVRQVIWEKLGFNLCCEVRYVSPQGAIMAAHIKADEFQENKSSS
ncbi:UDP-N-acetylmuramate dehydrogenase [Desulfuromusa kysingii]|uniref:UDP-N-acetylenolpyruvoylglucosamine reductase n=1 Tax=Desulfuromusa kysingii TaxID=37625 RepID=A0A1H3YCE2_9BACT|nr:UDP-N-acetylmuramate dehydrogenase [Desulfuromusa kysingii]SEA09246.1 UDP-N-acetylmuramate dehydrogenase [Desulfuromusa kysingii]